jgi:hypothetical protein
MTHADAGQFTVPSYILSVLPTGKGGVQVQNSLQLPITATGIDIGLADATITKSEAATYQ